MNAMIRGGLFCNFFDHAWGFWNHRVNIDYRMLKASRVIIKSFRKRG